MLTWIVKYILASVNIGLSEWPAQVKSMGGKHTHDVLFCVCVYERERDAHTQRKEINSALIKKESSSTLNVITLLSCQYDIMMSPYIHFIST